MLVYGHKLLVNCIVFALFFLLSHFNTDNLVDYFLITFSPYILAFGCTLYKKTKKNVRRLGIFRLVLV